MRILIVEDDVVLGELLREYLQRLAHEKVRVCVTGSEAFAVVEEETFDCAFVDLRLPDIDGLRLLDAVKSQDPGLPVVMMSGYPTMEHTIEAMRKGASDFLTKPFTLQDVALTLERLTKERKLLMENLSLQFESQARKELELVNRELEAKIREQTTLFEISKQIDAIRSSEELYPCIVRLASSLVDVAKVSFFVLPPERNSLMLIAEHGAHRDETASCFFPMPDDSLKEMLGQDSDHVLMHSEDFLKLFKSGRVPVSGRGDLSCWPIRIRGELFGFLTVSHNGTCAQDALTPMNVKIFDFLIRKAALAIENMALYESLIGNFYGILRSLVNALEAKDLYTGKHSERVTGYAIAIARNMQCSGAQIEVLQTVGYLHDIGKIGIKDSILNKPGPLTLHEFELVKEHPSIGESIVAELGLSHEERSIIRHHHERWDGGGYPDGLAGKEIPLLARIVTVADAFDAMTSKRAYREAMSPDEASRELKRSRAKQFDPQVLDAFLEVLGSNCGA